MGEEEVNPIPVAIADIYSDNLNFRLLKDIPITQPIVNSGIFLYDTTPRVGNRATTYGGSPISPNRNQWEFHFGMATQDALIRQIEINGNTYYYTEEPGD